MFPAPLPEDLVWDYIIQLASALRLIHGSHLSVRCLDPTKVLVTTRHRLRVNCGAVIDILTFDPSAPPLSPTMNQVKSASVLSITILCVSLSRCCPTAS